MIVRHRDQGPRPRIRAICEVSADPWKRRLYVELAEFTPSLPTEDAKAAILKYGGFLFHHLEEAPAKKLVEHLISLAMRTVKPEEFQLVLSVHAPQYFQYLDALVLHDQNLLTVSLWNDYVVSAVDVRPGDLPSILSNPNVKLAFTAIQAVRLRRRRRG
jgi:hypothetical protein